jgi:outer membrane protein assembly factor BamA
LTFLQSKIDSRATLQEMKLGQVYVSGVSNHWPVRRAIEEASRDAALDDAEEQRVFDGRAPSASDSFTRLGSLVVEAANGLVDSGVLRKVHVEFEQGEAPGLVDVRVTAVPGTRRNLSLAVDSTMNAEVSSKVGFSLVNFLGFGETATLTGSYLPSYSSAVAQANAAGGDDAVPGAGSGTGSGNGVQEGGMFTLGSFMPSRIGSTVSYVSEGLLANASCRVPFVWGRGPLTAALYRDKTVLDHASHRQQRTGASLELGEREDGTGFTFTASAGSLDVEAQPGAPIRVFEDCGTFPFASLRASHTYRRVGILEDSAVPVAGITRTVAVEVARSGTAGAAAGVSLVGKAEASARWYTRLFGSAGFSLGAWVGALLPLSSLGATARPKVSDRFTVDTLGFRLGAAGPQAPKTDAAGGFSSVGADLAGTVDARVSFALSSVEGVHFQSFVNAGAGLSHGSTAADLGAAVRANCGIGLVWALGGGRCVQLNLNKPLRANPADCKEFFQIRLSTEPL